jgi:hypothetical protein
MRHIPPRSLGMPNSAVVVGYAQQCCGVLRIDCCIKYLSNAEINVSACAKYMIQQSSSSVLQHAV